MTGKRIGIKRAATPKAKSQAHWDRIDLLTDKEIAVAMASDPGAAPMLSEEWFRDAKLEPPEIKRGVFMHLAPAVVAWFKAADPGYQARMNRVLKSYVLAHAKPVGKKKG
jgi:uncharacterized protein (DUF4415 family)